MIVRRFVDEGVHALVNTNVRFEVGLIDPPDVALSNPPADQYAIMYPIPGEGPYIPCLTGVESDVTLYYQVTSVGADRRQASWVADQVRRAWSDRDPATGAFIYECTVEDHIVQDRAAEGIGAPALESGVYQVVDTYSVKVSRADAP